MKRPFRWRSLLWCLIPTAVAAGMYWVLPHFPRFTEYAVTRGLFRVVSYPVEWLLSLLPFSLTEWWWCWAFRRVWVCWSGGL